MGGTTIIDTSPRSLPISEHFLPIMTAAYVSRRVKVSVIPNFHPSSYAYARNCELREGRLAGYGGTRNASRSIEPLSSKTAIEGNVGG